MAEFSGDAAAAAIWTQGVLGDEQRSWLEELEPVGHADGVELFHGSPRNAVWDYVLSEGVALESLRLTTAPLVLVGHSHVALALVLSGETIAGGLAPARNHSRPLRRPLAAQPRLRRPAARRRRACGLGAD